MPQLLSSSSNTFVNSVPNTTAFNNSLIILGLFSLLFNFLKSKEKLFVNLLLIANEISTMYLKKIC